MKYHSDSEHLQVVSSPYPFPACRTHVSIFHFTSPLAFFQPQLPICSSCRLPHSANDHCFRCSGQRPWETVLDLYHFTSAFKIYLLPATSSHLPFTSRCKLHQMDTAVASCRAALFQPPPPSPPPPHHTICSPNRNQSNLFLKVKFMLLICSKATCGFLTPLYSIKAALTSPMASAAVHPAPSLGLLCFSCTGSACFRAYDLCPLR